MIFVEPEMLEPVPKSHRWKRSTSIHS